jgi:hypothetical protein
MIWLRYKIPSSYNPRLLAPTVSSVFLVETSLNPLHPDPARFQSLKRKADEII